MSQAVVKHSQIARSSLLTASQTENLLSFVTGIGVAGLLVYGWLTRGDTSINPENGIGYALGIIGGSMMLLLLIYPFRKRIRYLSAIGSVGFWFRFHMLLGLLGPVAVLYHSRYSWGALNSAVALTAMLIVAGSGLIGRFLYSRVHRGYSGRKIEVRALLLEMRELLESLTELGHDGEVAQARLVPFEHQAVAAGTGFWTSAKAVIQLGVSTRTAQRQLKREILNAPTPGGIAEEGMRIARQKLLAQSAHFFQAVRRAGEFAYYDRMLRLWHILHLPLFFILVATAILHIIAVHMY
ncbi:MAG: hypothetical protein ABL918_00195 [Chakrabartia sp.]